MAWVPFYYDCNGGFGLISSAETWDALVGYIMNHRKTDRLNAITYILDGRVATKQEILRVASEGGNYFAGAPGVEDGTVPSFGYRREHVGSFALRGWANTHNMLKDLV